MPAPPLVGDVLPTRRLRPLAGGGAVRVGPNFTRVQVLVVPHPEPCEDCAAYLASFAEVAEGLSAEKAAVLALVSAGWADAIGQPPAPVLALLDEHGLTARLLSPGHTPVVAVVDRFGQVFARFDAGPEHCFPAHAEILTRLLDIAIRCPECGVPDVPCLTELVEPGVTSGGMRIGQ